jgi:hypothetical protein
VTPSFSSHRLMPPRRSPGGEFKASLQGWVDSIQKFDVGIHTFLTCLAAQQRSSGRWACIILVVCVVAPR